MYNPVFEIVPRFVFPPTTPFTSQSTDVLELLDTTAMNCCCPEAAMIVEAGEIDTATGGVIVINALANFDTSACATALTDTLGGFGTVSGAVYSPPAVIVPTDALPEATPFTCQTTAVFEVPVTSTVNCSENPACNCFAVGEIETTMSGGGGVELPPPPHPGRLATSNTIRHRSKPGSVILRSHVVSCFGVLRQLTPVPPVGHTSLNDSSQEISRALHIRA